MSDTPDCITKTCPICGIEKPATEEFFYKHKDCKCGIENWCKDCHRERNRQNTAKLRESEEYKQLERDRNKSYRENHPEEVRAYNKKYYWDNVERERERIRRNKKRFAPRIRAYKREYNIKNADAVLLAGRKRHARKMATDPKYRENYSIWHKKAKAKRRMLENNAEGGFAKEDLLRIYDEQEGRCAYCGIRIFWDIPNDLHVEHIKPLSRGGSNWPDNICLSCADCNLSKSDKTVEEWELVRGW